MKLKLGPEPPDSYLAKELEDRVLVSVQRYGMCKDMRHSEQLWFGLAHIGYDWDKDVLQILIRSTAQEMGSWEELKCLAQTSQAMVFLTARRGITLSEVQRGQIAAAVLAAILSADDDILALAADSLTLAAVKMGLPLSPEAVKRLHDCLATMPLRQGRRRITTTLANALYDIVRLGYQPTPAEAQQWQARFVDGLPTEGSANIRDATSWMLMALSSCRNYMPPPEVKAQLAALAEALPPNCDMGVATRTLAACKRWGVSLKPDVAQRLQRRQGKRGAAHVAR
ncbi:hypothetical protein GPECTOR_41g645 [Gonium pectorale]|uniref:FAST kinase leucine-rich domain-containing protein n=1 Tax=Gonium pectorale TaxID=33097 RepID=A0A150GA16_GONPE|nr:hypothetical protein GPECTOR_41g645 [Gonium pectorale]|eukprot:KXZ46681.1 hypothetical protein GPECTOR_41g645 [Gonium pectorale]